MPKQHKTNTLALVVAEFNRCELCDSDEHLETHHVAPRCAGGTNSLSNLVRLCRKCHAEAHSDLFQGKRVCRENCEPVYIDRIDFIRHKLLWGYVKHMIEERKRTQSVKITSTTEAVF